jgi:hypothetical protein
MVSSSISSSTPSPRIDKGRAPLRLGLRLHEDVDRVDERHRRRGRLDAAVGVRRATDGVHELGAREVDHLRAVDDLAVELVHRRELIGGAPRGVEHLLAVELEEGEGLRVGVEPQALAHLHVEARALGAAERRQVAEAHERLDDLAAGLVVDGKLGTLAARVGVGVVVAHGHPPRANGYRCRARRGEREGAAGRRGRRCDGGSQRFVGGVVG